VCPDVQTLRQVRLGSLLRWSERRRGGAAVAQILPSTVRTGVKLVRALSQAPAAHEEQQVGPVPLEDLLAAVARGDHSAYELVYERVTAAVYGIVRRVLRDPAQSEEVTQEALLQVWTNAPRYDPGRGSAQSWIMTIAHRRAVDRVRSEESTKRCGDRYAGREVPAEFDCVAEDVTMRLEQAAVRKCLATLTALQREAITLTYYDGWTYPEAAKRLGAPLGTVKTRIRDGLIRMRDCLAVTA
jgi:RNA polymerase sigma-70 factor, ECF subfamily